MALITAFFYLGVVLVMACLAVALGLRLLQWFRLAQDVGPLEGALYAAGLSFAILGVAAFGLGTVGWLRQGTALILLVVGGLVAGGGWRRLYELMTLVPGVGKRIRDSGVALLLTLAIAGCVVLDSLLAMAPLTGSDALVYHFTVPMLGLAKGAEPLFWLVKGFWTGQGHALIELGLALGSDRISMGLILVGGLLAAGALFVLTRHLTSKRWAGLAVLIFLLTPMVFWQMGTSGSPDIWMAFYTTLAVMAVNRGIRFGENRWLVLGGVLAGAAAGVKLTGWAIPVGIVTYCLFATRSLHRTVACGLSSLPAGILPFVRNAWWTGDPFFPFLTRWLRPENLNYYALRAIQADTHPVGFHRSVSGLLAFPFLLSIKGDAYGVGQYFGPSLLALAPLLLFAFRRGGLAHAAAFVWAVVFLSIDLTSQFGRFLLPVFPLALALIFVGVAEAFRRGWRVVKVGCAGTLLLTLLFGVGSETLYARDFLPVVVGLEKREAFLERMAPDYLMTSFVNRSLEGQQGKAMVFFQHVYYLRIPFLIGDPDISWLMDPDRLTGTQALLQLFRQQNVRWVVKAPDYPEPFAAAFQTLEDEGKLRPMFSADASTYADFRIYGEKVPVHLVIMEVASAP
jgi:4-amino-4-deoxy-L-arabinose transferase-like glycosyltransferase